MRSVNFFRLDSFVNDAFFTESCQSFLIGPVRDYLGYPNLAKVVIEDKGIRGCCDVINLFEISM